MYRANQKFVMRRLGLLTCAAVCVIACARIAWFVIDPVALAMVTIPELAIALALGVFPALVLLVWRVQTQTAHIEAYDLEPAGQAHGKPTHGQQKHDADRPIELGPTSVPAPPVFRKPAAHIEAKRSEIPRTPLQPPVPLQHAVGPVPSVPHAGTAIVTSGTVPFNPLLEWSLSSQVDRLLEEQFPDDADTESWLLQPLIQPLPRPSTPVPSARSEVPKVVPHAAHRVVREPVGTETHVHMNPDRALDPLMELFAGGVPVLSEIAATERAASGERRFEHVLMRFRADG